MLHFMLTDKLNELLIDTHFTTTDKTISSPIKYISIPQKFDFEHLFR